MQVQNTAQARADEAWSRVIATGTDKATEDWKQALDEVQKQNEALAWEEVEDARRLLTCVVGQMVRDLPAEIQARYQAVVEASEKYITVLAGDPL